MMSESTVNDMESGVAGRHGASGYIPLGRPSLERSWPPQALRFFVVFAVTAVVVTALSVCRGKIKTVIEAPIHEKVSDTVNLVASNSPSYNYYAAPGYNVAGSTASKEFVHYNKGNGDAYGASIYSTTPSGIQAPSTASQMSPAYVPAWPWANPAQIVYNPSPVPNWTPAIFSTRPPIVPPWQDRILITPRPAPIITTVASSAPFLPAVRPVWHETKMGTSATLPIITTVTTTTTMLAITTTATTTKFNPKLFCFAALMPQGDELALMRTLLQRGESIFACDEYQAYSSQEVELSPGPPVRITTQNIGSMKCEYGGPYHLALNSEIFVRIWSKVFNDGRYKRTDWTAKVDPDAVFLPQRLRDDVKHADPNAKVYLNNCDQGLHGPIEVLARGGMEAFNHGISKCVQKLRHEWGESGEDVFLRHCLGMLEVNRVDDFNLLDETVCFWGDPVHRGCFSGKVSFHPFKHPEGYFKCLKEANSR